MVQVVTMCHELFLNVIFLSTLLGVADIPWWGLWLLLLKEWLQGSHFTVKDVRLKQGIILLSELMCRHICKTSQGFPWEMGLDLSLGGMPKIQTMEQRRHKHIFLEIFPTTIYHRHSHRKKILSTFWVTVNSQ